MLTPNELNSAIFKDVGYAAEYSAGLMRLSGTYTVFVAWPHVKAALTTVHGQKAFKKFEPHLRSKFVSVYQKTLEKNENDKDVASSDKSQEQPSIQGSTGQL